jgi:hypothetical protein
MLMRAGIASVNEDAAVGGIAQHVGWPWADAVALANNRKHEATNRFILSP